MTHLRLTYDFFWISAPNFADVSADAFNAMVGNVDLQSDNQADLAKDVLEAMIVGPPTTVPPIPTRTQDPDKSTTILTTTEEPATSVGSTTTTEQTEEEAKSECEIMLKKQNSTQKALETMLNAECYDSRYVKD